MSKELKIEFWPITNLTPYDNNAKKHDPAQVARIADAIRRTGWDQPIVVDKDGVIIKGHGRRLAALELGLTKVPVVVRYDLTHEQAKVARLADNRVAESDIDPEMLRAELASMEESMVGIFDLKELDFMSADLGAMNDDVFVDDMGAVLEGQRHDIEQRMDAAAGKRIPLAKAFGFKDIGSDGMFAITHLMAKAESSTGLKNDAALVAFASTVE
jgi:hypothetical protein